VLAGGEVSLCCLDYDGQCILGRVMKTPRFADNGTVPLIAGAAVAQRRRQGEISTFGKLHEIVHLAGIMLAGTLRVPLAGIM